MSVLPTLLPPHEVARKLAKKMREAEVSSEVSISEETVHAWALSLDVLADRVERELPGDELEVPPVERGYVVEWDLIEPKVAMEEGLVCISGSPVIGPINELGMECPWPWEPQQLGGAPMGQYHCGYCGGMQLAGIPHSDWSLPNLDPLNNEIPAEFNHPRRPK